MSGKPSLRSRPLLGAAGELWTTLRKPAAGSGAPSITVVHRALRHAASTYRRSNSRASRAGLRNRIAAFRHRGLPTNAQPVLRPATGRSRSIQSRILRANAWSVRSGTSAGCRAGNRLGNCAQTDFSFSRRRHRPRQSTRRGYARGHSARRMRSALESGGIEMAAAVDHRRRQPPGPNGDSPRIGGSPPPTVPRERFQFASSSVPRPSSTVREAGPRPARPDTTTNTGRDHETPRIAEFSEPAITEQQGIDMAIRRWRRKMDAGTQASWRVGAPKAPHALGCRQATVLQSAHPCHAGPGQEAEQ